MHDREEDPVVLNASHVTQENVSAQMDMIMDLHVLKWLKKLSTAILGELRPLGKAKVSINGVGHMK